MTESLAGRLLVASPTLEEPTFHRTVVLMLAHNDEGALGVVLNRPSDAEVGELLPAWADLAAEPPTVFTGGPVSPTAVICLGELRGGDDARTDEPIDVEPVVAGLTTIDLTQPPESVAGAVSRIRVFAGYSGWDGGQLEGELDDGGWIVVDRTPADAMTDDVDGLWRRVLSRSGGRAALYARAPDHLWLN